MTMVDEMLTTLEEEEMITTMLEEKIMTMVD